MLKCKSFLKFLVKFLLFFLVIVFLPGIPPNPTFPFEEFSITKSKNLAGGPFKVTNNHLNNGERLFEGRLLGPEHLLVRGNSIFATLATGEVVKIDGDIISKIAQFGKDCSKPLKEENCGRPLGMNFDTQGDNLIVADAFYGIFEVNLKNGEKKQLVASNTIINGPVPRRAKFFNSVAVAKNGDIYWTDSSSDFGLADTSLITLMNPSGRLVHYSRATKTNTVLLDKIYMANGLALSKQEDFIVMNDLFNSRLLKYHLKGAKQGTSEVFIDELPGVADNLTPDADGIWVPLVASFDDENPLLIQSLAQLPYVRKFLVRMLFLVMSPFELISNLYPNIYSDMVIHKIRALGVNVLLSGTRTTIVRVDWSGKVVDVMHGFDKSVHAISHVLEHNDHLYLGSPFNNYLGRVKFVNKKKVHP